MSGALSIGLGVAATAEQVFGLFGGVTLGLPMARKPPTVHSATVWPGHRMVGRALTAYTAGGSDIVGKPCKQKHYLDELGDPLLPDDRRMALRFMLEVALTRSAEGLFPTPRDFSDEEAGYRQNLRCVNCDEPLTRASLFCDDLCRQLVQTVRLIRKAEADQRIKEPDMQAAIGVRLFMLTGGGYPENERRLSKSQRTDILERDKFTCQICGKPADQVDHIAGNLSDPNNLQALCGACNRAKAFSNTREVTEDEATDIRDMFSGMASRIAAPEPAFLCDDPERWDKCCMSIVGARKRLLNQLTKRPRAKRTRRRRAP